MSQNTRVWSRFILKSKKGELKLRIQDAPSDRIEDVIDIFVKYFVTEETGHKAAGIYKNKDAMAESREFVTELINDLSTDPHNVLICCLDEDDDVVGEFLGASLTVIAQKDDPVEEMNFTTRTKELADMFGIMDKLFTKYDVMKELKLDSFYDDRGIVIHPDYRGLGLAQYFMNIRQKVCYLAHVPLCGAWMTSFGSQKAAARCGWETVYEISFEELQKETGFTFADAPPTCKFMVAKPIPVD